ncbi:MAG: PAS domain S-box protein [Chloroflexota bacterium]
MSEYLTHLKIVHQIGQKLASLSTLDEVYEQATCLVHQTFAYHHVAIFLVNEDTLKLKSIVGTYKHHFSANHCQPLDEGIISQVAKQGKKIAVNDIQVKPYDIDSTSELRPTQGELCLPIKIDGMTIGILDIQCSAQQTFEENTILALETVVDQIAGAIDNAKSHEALKQELAQRKQTEQALQSSQEFSRQIVSSINHHIYVTVVDVERQTTNIYISPNVEDLTGYNPDLLLNNWHFWGDQIIHPDDKSRSLKQAQSLIEGKSSETEYRIIRADDQIIWVRDSAQVIEEAGNYIIYGVVSDISESKRVEGRLQDTVSALQQAYHQAREHTQNLHAEITRREQVETALEQSQEYLQSIMDNVADAIITIDQHGIIQTFNLAAERIFGYSATTIIGKKVNRLMPKFHRQNHDHYLANYLQTGESKIIGHGRELVGLRQDGTTFPLDLAISEFPLKDQRMFVGIVRDITKRVQLEQQLRQAQKMDALGRLAGGIAHDFNNILTIIAGQSELLLSNLDDQHYRQQPDLEQIKSASQRAQHLVQQLLAFSRQTPVQAQVLNLNDVIENLSGMISRLIGEDITLSPILAPDIGYIKADTNQMEQVLLNLTLNAREAMSHGGQITLRTQSVYLRETLSQTHTTIPPGSYVRLIVEDNGQGISEKSLLHIFEPFFTTKDVGKGTGLGLSIVYGIVQQSDGFIQADSTEGEGTTFALYFPQAQPPDKSETHSKSLPADLSGHETILLVEDDDGVRLVTRKFLQKWGYRVFDTSQPEEALSLCKQYGKQIDLLITDVIMPEISGRELAEQVLLINPELRVLYISGYTDDLLNSHGLFASDIALLDKPFSSTALGQKVRDMFDN